MMIDYQKRSFEAAATVANLFSINDFKTKVDINLSPDSFAKILDDYQFLKCQDAERCDKNDPRRTDLLEKRDKAIDLLTALHATVELYKQNPKGLKKELKNAVRNIQKFLGMEDLVSKQAKFYDKLNISQHLDVEQEVDVTTEDRIG